MGTTANLGLPYPENTDALADMAAAIEALANAIETKLPGKIARGSSGLVTFNASGEYVLTHGLGVVPTAIVFAQAAGAAGSALLITAKSGTLTSTQVTVVARNGTAAYVSAAASFMWIAIA